MLGRVEGIHILPSLEVIFGTLFKGLILDGLLLDVPPGLSEAKGHHEPFHFKFGQPPSDIAGLGYIPLLFPASFCFVFLLLDFETDFIQHFVQLALLKGTAVGRLLPLVSETVLQISVDF